ncbi:allophanate hydrolase [Pseudomonas sp. 21]|uniref:5-oxoprolinase subunit C family protein n=1 Tax=unclassified Pseudomonas TaxID=196821 RepID=UPI0005EB3459|nr:MULTISPECIES: biotin-dependent carboxyltransferase family protein [unclassified Pseudomonas]KJK01595.1 allophanate hydrolase [Pseudomonas sp. 21]MBV7582240.1 biotin-dependent carboxyltransferase family protein [Pseudomonas sp. PDM33]
MSLKVIACGPLCLLQDGGRQGWQHLGVSPGGPVDKQAAAWANRLLGNTPGVPLLEIALGGVELEVQADTWLALTGADVPATLDGEPLPGWSRFRAGVGQRLKLGFARAGQRAYLATAGGFHAPSILGSVATQTREKLGGLAGNGQPLAADDLLECAACGERFTRGASVPWPYRPDYRETPTLRVLPGPDAFSEEQRQAFFEQRWQVSPQSDRMGVRLRGEALSAPRRQWSLGIVEGAIQVPPDGQPIVLLADRQSMGGYPLLGVLHPLDIGRLAQCPAHSEVRFAQAHVEQAQADLRAFRRFFSG